MISLADNSLVFRHLRPLCGSLVATSIFLLQSAASVGYAEDWPAWRGPRGNGSWSAPPLAEQWPDEGLPLLWRCPLGPGYSGISVVGSRVYTMDRPSTEVGRERVVCINAASGKLIWEHLYNIDYGDLQYGKGPRATPTVHADRVYTIGATGELRCLDAASGSLVWAKSLAAKGKDSWPTWGFAASPVIYRDKLIVHAAFQPDGCFLAVDRMTGDEIWRAGEGPAGYCTPIVIQHIGEAQLVGWTPERVICLSPDNGSQHWAVPYKVTMGVSIATPIFHDGVVFVSGYWEGSKAIRLGVNDNSAQLIWEENRSLRGLMSQPLYRDGLVYLLDKRHGLVCFVLDSGQILWTDENRLTPRGRNPQVTMVWVGDSNTALGLNSEGVLVRCELTAKGYRELTRAKIVGPTWAHPAYVGNRIYARDDEQLVSVELPLRRSP